jgi:hypothetical protein
MEDPAFWQWTAPLVPCRVLLPRMNTGLAVHRYSARLGKVVLGNVTEDRVLIARRN